ncbi:MAG TPA: RnfH family protein [Nevskiaceae bacterium]|nr:RnfH family protein [Nevskiaceae bacterium]
MPTIEVAWAGPDAQWLVQVEVPPGTTLLEAVRRSGVLERLGDAAPATPKLGVFGRPKPGDTVVEEGDRVEIYRELAIDPKDARRQRAKDAPPRRRR